MAGRAQTQAINAWLESNARKYFDLEPAELCDTLAYVAARIEELGTFKAVAQECEHSLCFEVSAARLTRCLEARYGAEETESAINSARIRASHSLAEESVTLTDAQALTPVEVSRNASRSRSRQWLAERRNPSQYGGQKGANVSISIGSLHLDALLHKPHEVARQATASLHQPSASNDHVTSAVPITGHILLARPSQVEEAQEVSIVSE